MSTTATLETEVEPHEPHWISSAAFPILSVALVLAQLLLGIVVHAQLIWLAIPLGWIALKIAESRGYV